MQIEAWVSRDTDGRLDVFVGDHPVDDGNVDEGVVWISGRYGEYLEACSGMDDHFPSIAPGECRKATITVSLL